MRIGELSRQTGVSPRSLRYYEQQGMLHSQRLPNGYREYDDASVETVLTIQAFFSAGLSTKIIRDILLCSTRAPKASSCPELLSRVLAVRDDLEARAALITAHREKLEEYLISSAGWTQPG